MSFRPFRVALISLASLFVYACSHPIEIVGQGDVISASGDRNCYLEDFQAAQTNCTQNSAIGAYQETYYAVPRPGWKFDHWGNNYCPNATPPNYDCSFNISAETVKQYWGQTMPPLRAVFTSCSAPEPPGCAGKPGYTPDYRHFYGVVWRGSDLDNLRFARQMGYGHIANHGNMRRLPEAEGFKFFMVNPELTASPVGIQIDVAKGYSTPEIAIYERLLAWKDASATFPNNIASGWWYDSQKFLIVYDFQQQAVIDMLVEAIIRQAKSLENPAISYTFAGLMWDVPDLDGDFWTGPESTGGNAVDLIHWTGKDSCASSSHNHDYPTYADGKANFYKQLYQRTREEFQDPKFIGEPFLIYDRWIKQLESRPDALELMPDMLTQEGAGTGFVDDERIYAGGLITRDRVGLTTPRAFEHQDNLTYAAKAAISGSWYNWFGKFGGDGNMPDYRNVYDVPARLQLIRVIPGWDNLKKVPLLARSWNGTRYTSPNSYADARVIYSRHPVTGKIFAVFLSSSGVVKLSATERLVSVERTDGTFVETVSGYEDVEYANNEIRLTSLKELGKGYIITTQGL